MRFKTIAGVLLSFFLFSGMAFAAEVNQMFDRQSAWTLAKGTVIPIEAVDSVNSKNCQKGQKVSFKLKKDIESNGSVIIPADTRVEGTVIKVRRTGPWDGSGEIDLGFSEIKTKNGQSVPVDGKLEVKGKTPNFFIRYSLFGVLIRGKNVKVEKGTTLDLKVANDIVFSEEKEDISTNTTKNKQKVNDSNTGSQV